MAKAKTSKKPTKSQPHGMRDRINNLAGSIKRRVDGLLARRPHRSFRRTRRRDYSRTLKLPGYWSFTNIVRRTIWEHRSTFGLLALVYALLTIVLVGVTSQDLYTQLQGVLEETGTEILGGNWEGIGKAGMLLFAGVTGSFTETLTEGQQIYASIILLFTWLTTVWLLRAMLAGHTPRLRDGLYNAGAPVLATFLVAIVMVIQLLPLALAIVGFSAATASGLLNDGGVEAMLFWVMAGLLALLTLYWVTSTFMALVVVTLPGMYPMRALRTAGDLVIGRRIRILLRLLWMLLIVAIAWVVVVIPFILLDAWLKSLWPMLQWLPIVPVVLLAMSTVTIVWSASYVYMLYRRIVDDDANPA
jgi:hypothetical protein